MGPSCLGPLILIPPLISFEITPSLSLLVCKNEDNSISQCIGLLLGFSELPRVLAHNGLFTDIGCFHTALWKGFGLPQAVELGEIRQFLPELKV